MPGTIGLVVKAPPLDRVSSYSYDPLYRLTAETIIDADNGNHTANYIYDAVSNRVQETVDGVSRNFSYDANDRLLTAGADSYNYDPLYRLTAETIIDPDNGNHTASYIYDAVSNRVKVSPATLSKG